MLESTPPTESIHSTDASATPEAIDAPPATPTRSTPREAIITAGLRRTILLFVGSVGTFAGLLAMASMLDAANVHLPEYVMDVGVFAMIASFVVLCVGVPISAIHAIGTTLWTRDPITERSVFRFLLTASLGLVGMFAGYLALAGFGRGRQIRVRGKILLPRVGLDSGFLVRRPEVADAPGAEVDSTSALPDDEVLRSELASMWRENGRTEHASVAAFARLTLDLMALGAPSRLLVDAQRDALDEIRHAELCFSLAHELDGRALGPLAFPEVKASTGPTTHRMTALATLAVDSLIDGAVHEGLSARVVARLAKQCRIPSIRSVLKQIAADEGRHAAHGWDVVEWCVEVGGQPVLAALRGACVTLASWTPPAGKSGPRTAAYEPFGIPSRAIELEEGERTRVDVLARVERLVGAQTAVRVHAA